MFAKAKRMLELQIIQLQRSQFHTKCHASALQSRMLHLLQCIRNINPEPFS